MQIRTWESSPSRNSERDVKWEKSSRNEENNRKKRRNSFLCFTNGKKQAKNSWFDFKELLIPGSFKDSHNLTSYSSFQLVLFRLLMSLHPCNSKNWLRTENMLERPFPIFGIGRKENHTHIHNPMHCYSQWYCKSRRERDWRKIGGSTESKL